MKLLVADDEDYTREGLVVSIPWEEYGITEIMQARDGVAALRIAKWFMPDIIITDIRMPRLNGVEFVRKLAGTRSHVIFITGYMEINYLKSAIDLSATAFIEKPVDISKLMEAVNKARMEIERNNMQSCLNEDVKVLREQQLVNMLISGSNLRESVMELCTQVGFPVNMIYQCLILWDKSDVPSGLPQKTGDLASKHGLDVLGAFMNTSNGRYILLLHYSQQKRNEILSFQRSILNINDECVLAVGLEVDDIFQIHTCYLAAEKALGNIFFNEEKRLFVAEEETVVQNAIKSKVCSEFKKILKDSPEQFTKPLTELCEMIKRTHHIKKENIITYVISLTEVIYREYDDLYTDGIEGISRNEDINAYVNSLLTFSQVKEFILKLLNMANNNLLNHTKYSGLISNIKKYIIDRYAEPGLSIMEIAEHFGFSVTYLNVLFKQHTQSTIKQYLQDYRIGAAKSLLLKSVRISETAKLCGFSCSNYFSKAFKESTGLSPGEYRSDGKHK